MIQIFCFGDEITAQYEAKWGRIRESTKKSVKLVQNLLIKDSKRDNQTKYTRPHSDAYIQVLKRDKMDIMVGKENEKVLTTGLSSHRSAIITNMLSECCASRRLSFGETRRDTCDEPPKKLKLPKSLLKKKKKKTTIP